MSGTYPLGDRKIWGYDPDNNMSDCLTITRILPKHFGALKCISFGTTQWGTASAKSVNMIGVADALTIMLKNKNLEQIVIRNKQAVELRPAFDSVLKKNAKAGELIKYLWDASNNQDNGDAGYRLLTLSKVMENEKNG